MIRRALNRLLSPFGLELIRPRKPNRLLESEIETKELLQLVTQAGIFEGTSSAQIHQDVIVLLATGFKTNGYFVEFGASDGIKFSNTYLLEKEYGWQGILAEPGKVWHTDLASNRDTAIDHACVWSSSHDTLSFTEANVASLSTISRFCESDHHAKTRRESTTYEVKTLSLNDLLEKHNAPRQIDYLSIDTEGSEFEILNSFNFDKYEISIITCEHNFTRNREQIFNLLSRHGYRRKFTTLSKFDDWYFKDSVFQAVEEHSTS